MSDETRRSTNRDSPQPTSSTQVSSARPKASRKMERRIVQVEPGLLRIEQRLCLSKCEVGTDVSGPACIYAVVRVRRGEVAYLRGDSWIRAPRCFAVFLPPFQVVQASLEHCDVTSVALAFRPRASEQFPRQAVLLASDAQRPARSRADAVHGTLTTATSTNIGRAPDPAPLAANTKAIIDGKYGASLQIAHIADRLHASPAVLSRRFRRTYGLSPVRYRHQVRVMDALMRFAEGAVPVDVFQDVGFDDLSRFYKIFRKIACAPPGLYRHARSRIAKT